jgi:hypothetical protein
MNAPTKEQSSSRSFGSPALDRRTLLGIGGAVGLAALAGCSAAATAGTPTGSTAGTSSSSSSGNTQLSAGTYTATFSSSGGGDGPGGGVFAAASGAITIDGITIRTSKDSSRGLDATYTGTVTAKDVDITTAGAHCACLATDRGNGTITVTGESRLASSGDGSPLVYSTGDISVAGATGTATGAQTMVIEGKNKISVDGCTFDTSGTTGMMVYQSFSGDAADSDATAEKASLVIKDSSITSTTAKPMIYVTNTTCQIEVTSSKLTHPASTPLLSLAEDRWGTSGSNGGHAAVTFTDCTVKGALEADASSSATVTLKSGHLTGGTSGDVEVTKDTSSTWSH